MAKTRSSTAIHLIGQPSECFDGNVLPTTADVLRVHFYRSRVKGLSQKDSLKSVVQEIFAIWRKVDIPVREEKNVTRQLMTLLSTYRNLGRSKKRGGATQVDKEKQFVVSISGLFDVGKHNALTLIKDDNCKLFLCDQRTDIKYTIPMLQKIRETDERQRIEQFKMDKARLAKEWEKEKNHAEDDEMEKLVTTLSQMSSSDELVSSQSLRERNDSACSEEAAFEQREKCSRTSRKKKVVTETITMALDRANVSNAKAVHLIAALASACGDKKLDDISLSVSTVRRLRNANRAEQSAAQKKSFTCEDPLVVHFDGKLLPSLSGASKKEDRIAVVVSGLGGDKLLGVPSIESGKGSLIANANLSLIEEWNLRDKIVGMSFDTTAANTGLKNGACVLLEQKMDKELIWLACRHHILEIICKHSFAAVFGATDGPNVSLFKRFKDFWPRIIKETYDPCSDERLNNDLKELKARAVQFLLTSLYSDAGKQPREDYRELQELALLFLGERPPRGVMFRAPGAVHHARWMSKLIYVFKIYMFRDQFELTESEQRSCLEFGLFAALIYVKFWITCPNVVDAPLNDLQLIQNLAGYDSICSEISTAALKAFNRHLWYLGQELAPLSIFSELVCDETKKKIVLRLEENRNEFRNCRCRKYIKKGNLTDKTLDYFIGPASNFIFEVLGLSTSFFNINVGEWPMDPSYLRAKEVVRALSAVNDRAERAISLATEFNASRTKNEQQYQALLQVVEMHRNRFPDANKSTISLNL